MSEVWKGAIQLGCAQAEPYRLCDPPEAGIGRSGLQRGFLAGSSLDFKDHREYQPGDDLRHIDWNAFARTDRLTLKLYHEEIMPHLDLVLDATRSMALPDTDKQEATLALTSFFATAADYGGYSRNLLLAGEQCLPKQDGDRPPIMWTPIQFHGLNSPGPGIAAHAFKRHSVRIFISDLLMSHDPQQLVSALGKDAASLLVVQVLAAQDLHPLLGGKVRLEDSETGECHEMLLDSGALKRYEQALQAHQEQWRAAIKRVGAVFAVVEAESFLQDWRFPDEVLHRFLRVRGS